MYSHPAATFFHVVASRCFRLIGTAALLGLGSLPAVAGAANTGWSLSDQANPDEPGRRVLIEKDGQPLASLVYGEGQAKPFLHVYGDDGVRLTNPGINSQGETVGRFPHHRGIFIGWNKIRSDLGEADLWHMTHGAQMDALELERLHVSDRAATVVVQIAWRAGSKDDSGSDLLLTERREIVVSKPDGKQTQIDLNFILNAERDLKLDGDLQHAGIHFRADAAVDERRDETTYLWEPELNAGGGRIVGSDFKWNRLVFPLAESWRSAIQLNPPSTPVEELSWRDYGRFGFFFVKPLNKGESLSLDYRFIVENVEPPATGSEFSDAQKAQLRSHSDALYQQYLKDLSK